MLLKSLWQRVRQDIKEVSKQQKSRNKLSLGAGTWKFVFKDGWLRSRGVYGRFDVRVIDIETVTVSAVDRGKSTLKIIGHGTTLAEAIVPRNIAEKAQRFILGHVN